MEDTVLIHFGLTIFSMSVQLYMSIYISYFWSNIQSCQTKRLSGLVMYLHVSSRAPLSFLSENWKKSVHSMVIRMFMTGMNKGFSCATNKRSDAGNTGD